MGKIRVALVNITYVINERSFIMDENIGICSLASYLREKQRVVKLFNFSTLQKSDDIISDILRFAPHLVGFQPYLTTIEKIIELAERLKKVKLEIYIVLGGHFATFNSEEILEKEESVDFVVRGEGEETLLELTDQLENNKDMESVYGISYRKGKEIITTSNRPNIKNLDTLPFPARDILKLQIENGNRYPSAK